MGSGGWVVAETVEVGVVPVGLEIEGAETEMVEKVGVEEWFLHGVSRGIGMEQRGRLLPSSHVWLPISTPLASPPVGIGAP